MKLSVQVRITLFICAIILLSVLIGAGALITHNEIKQLHETFSHEQISSFEIADHLQASILKLNGSLISYQLNDDARLVAKFNTESEELNQWIDQQKPRLISSNEKALLNQVDLAYDDFLLKARQSVDKRAVDPTARLETMRELMMTSTAILEMGHRLAESHRSALETLLTESRQSIGLVQKVISAALILLLLLGGGMGFIVYREMLMPLRVQLVETSALLHRQEKLASLGILAAGVAHEIRNPLTAIKARIFTQIRNLPFGTAEYNNAKVIDSEINRLERIVKDFLQFARPAEPEFTLIKPAELFASLRQLLEPQLIRDKIDLKVSMETTAELKGDWEQLKQVLINLVQNGAESIGQNGTILLKAYTERRGTSMSHFLILEVKDTGKGITQEVQKRLFDPFYTTKETGTGLGLSIAARIIEKHHGFIEVEPIPGATAFKLLLPMER